MDDDWVEDGFWAVDASPADRSDYQTSDTMAYNLGRPSNLEIDHLYPEMASTG